MHIIRAQAVFLSPPETLLAPAKTSKTTKTASPKFWVGIGASAGGLEALRGFVRHLPENVSATYIVTQHVAPQHRSMLTEIIGRETPLPVREVTDEMLPDANTVYITPPNSNLVVKDGLLRLVEPSKQVAAPKPSVNTFFGSLALAKEQDAIGIILSGTGSDGALGIKEIHDAGGITIAQDYMTAKYSSMPVAAVDTGNVDLVMSPEEMAAQFSKIIATPRNLDVLRASPVNMDSVSELTQILLDQTKVNFRHYKTPTFQRRVERRMTAVGASSLSQYVGMARKSSDEVEALFRDLLITVTSFFRDPAEFEALRKYVREIIKERDGQPIRVWVAGTATGEEAYTIAIMFAEEMGGPGAFSNARIQIFASDLDSEAIEIARRGYYPETALVEVPEHIVRRYFQSAPIGFTVAKAIREKIVFSVHNIAQDPPLLNLDLVSCRNLLIYFQPQLQAQVFSRFHYGLKPRGVLFLGKSETTSAAEGLFVAANAEKHIFFQRPSQTANLMPREIFQQPNIVARRGLTHAPQESRELETVKSQLSSLIKAIGPNCLLVGSDLKVNSAFGDVSRYVGLSAGVVDGTITSLLREPYRQDVRASVPAVILNRKPYLGIIRKVEKEPNERVRLRIYPVENKPDEETQALVVFEEWTEVEVKRPNGDAQEEYYQNEIKSLSDELAIAKTNLMQMVEELETSNEELQALNEELQSSNEELQSTNEELETSNEELQSTNEELSTVNEEMQVNSQQVSALNQSLSSILENIAIPLLVVDRSLSITNLSRVGEDFFGISHDLALPHITRCKFPKGLPDIVELLNQAMTTGNKIEEVVDIDEFNATLTIVPHFENEVDLVGAIVLVADNTVELKDTRNELQLIFDNLPASILVRDVSGKILKANKVASTIMDKTVEDIEAGHMKDLCDKETWKGIRSLDKKSIKTGRAIVQEKIKYVSPKGSTRYLSTSRIPVKNSRSGQDKIYAMAMDVTQEHYAVRDLEISEKRLDEAVTIAGVGHWEWDIRAGTVFWSPNFERLVGLKVGSFGGTFEDFKNSVHPDDLSYVQSSVEGFMESDAPFDFEYRIQHKKKHYIWISAFGRCTLNSKGEAISMSGTVQEITKAKQSELEITERNRQLQMASKMASLGYWKIIPEEKSFFWSDEMYTIHGVSPDSFVPTVKSVLDLIHPEDIDAFNAARNRARKNQESFQVEARFVRPDGEVRYGNFRGETEVNAQGRLEQIFGTLHDVTDDRRSRNALANSEQRLEQAIKSSGLGFWEWNIKTGEEFWSERYREILGFPIESKVQSNEDFEALVHPEDLDMIRAANKVHLKDHTPYELEFRMRHRDGHYIWIADNAQATWDKDGKPSRMIGTIQDITKSKTQTQNLRALNEQLSLASKLSAVGYWQVDLVNETLFWSDQVFAIHGETPDSYSPKLASAIGYYHPDDVEMVQKALGDAINNGKPFEFEARVVRRDGQVRSVNSTSSLDIDTTGKVVSIFGVFKDVTEDRVRERELKELLDELSRSNEELNRFSYVCSHDMKEPVRMIESMSQMLLDPEIQSDKDQRDEILKRINTNMMRLRGIIDSLLAYSRVEARVEVTSVDLGNVVDEVLETLALSIEEQKTKVTHGKMPTINGARVHFVQLFQNLVGNALKHSDTDSPKIKISSATRQNEIVLRVEDNGQGVPKKSREQIFELFGRLKRRDETEGTGLGLSICKKIVAQYGGTIKCHDSKLGGAMFEITIPTPKVS